MPKLLGYLLFSRLRVRRTFFRTASHNKLICIYYKTAIWCLSCTGPKSSHFTLTLKEERFDLTFIPRFIINLVDSLFGVWIGYWLVSVSFNSCESLRSAV
jgi:hypothetical protein